MADDELTAGGVLGRRVYRFGTVFVVAPGSRRVHGIARISSDPVGEFLRALPTDPSSVAITPGQWSAIEASMFGTGFVEVEAWKDTQTVCGRSGPFTYDGPAGRQLCAACLRGTMDALDRAPESARALVVFNG